MGQGPDKHRLESGPELAPRHPDAKTRGSLSEALVCTPVTAESSSYDLPLFPVDGAGNRGVFDYRACLLDSPRCVAPPEVHVRQIWPFTQTFLLHPLIPSAIYEPSAQTSPSPYAINECMEVQTPNHSPCPGTTVSNDGSRRTSPIPNEPSPISEHMRLPRWLWTGPGVLQTRNYAILWYYEAARKHRKCGMKVIVSVPIRTVPATAPKRLQMGVLAVVPSCFFVTTPHE